MKTKLFVLLTLIGLSALAAFKSPTPVDDEAAIKAVIAAETQAFFDLNFAAWSDLWLQSAHDSQAWNNRDGSIFYTVGWDKVSAGAKSWIDAATKQPNPPNITRENWDFHFNGDMAAVGFDQHYSGAEGTTMSREYRTMVRKGGQWKISGVQAFWDYKNVKK
jgi:hypothetical protein